MEKSSPPAKRRAENKKGVSIRVIDSVLVLLRVHRLEFKGTFRNGRCLFFVIFAIIGCCGDALVGALDLEQEKSVPRVVGGPCEYNEYKGKATIVSVCRKEREKSRGGSPYENFEVKFSFCSEEEIKESFATKVEGREYTLMLTNSWHPGPKFLEKYGIEAGKTFDCYLKVITKGACTPILFDFPTIDLSDCFEKEKTNTTNYYF